MMNIVNTYDPIERVMWYEKKTYCSDLYYPKGLSLRENQYMGFPEILGGIQK